jgi:2,5-diketo-D-gluconate reductase B
VPREQIHLTTKVWWDRLEPKAMRQSLEDSLRALGTEQVDLFHIHWPGKDWDLARSIETLVALRDEGKARHIGVANFPLGLLRQVVETLGAPLSAIQVEYHVLLDQQPLLDYARSHDLLLTAYTPLARGQAAAQPVIQAIARKHGVLPSQVALKWLLDQDGVAAIPKASSRENQLANLAALNVQLDEDDRAAIAGLPGSARGQPGVCAGLEQLRGRRARRASGVMTCASTARSPAPAARTGSPESASSLRRQPAHLLL